MVPLPPVVNGGESKATVTISALSGGSGVVGAKVLLTDTSNTSNTYESALTGTAGGATISNVPYGTYTVTVSTTPTDYTTPTGISNLVVDSATETVNITFTTA